MYMYSCIMAIQHNTLNTPFVRISLLSGHTDPGDIDIK